MVEASHYNVDYRPFKPSVFFQYEQDFLIAVKEVSIKRCSSSLCGARLIGVEEKMGM
jgi:hypothetical protein